MYIYIYIYIYINKDILTNAIQFAKLHTTSDDKDLCLIMHCRKSLLFFGNEAWKKKSTECCFDVTMGSFDGAEICELCKTLYSVKPRKYTS